MKKYLTQREKDVLATELASQNNRSGVIGGYCEPSFPIYYANEEMAAMLGYDSVEELAERLEGKVSNTIHPEDMSQVLQDLGRDYYEGMTYETTYRMRRKDGSWFWTVDRGKVVRAEDGRLAILSVCSDMSDFVRRQKELENQNSISDYLFKRLPGGYVRCATDENLTIFYMSQRFLDIVGWTEEEIQTKFQNKYMNLVCPEDHGVLRKYIRSAAAGEREKSYSDEIYRLQSKDGYHWVSDATVRVTASGQTFYQCMITDISRFIMEQERREQELQQSLKEAKERYEIIEALGNVYQEISVMDLQKGTYQIVSGSGNLRDYQGINGRLSDFEAKILHRIIVPEQEMEAMAFMDFSTASERLRGKTFLAREFQGINGDWYLVTLIVKNREENGNVTRLLVSARNVTAQKSRELEYQKSLEEAVVEARRAGEAKSGFLSRMSHDIRTPLNGIIGLLKIDEAHFDDRELLLENHKKMTVSADHLLSLINDVLQMSKLEDGSVVLTHEFISLVDLTQDIVDIIVGRAVEAGLVWDYERGKTSIRYPYIYGSPVHLRQIFLNIYGNCIKYNRPGGKITTIVEALEEHHGICAYRWIISDTGVGMSQEFLDHIFEPFAQEKHDARSVYQGTGLGMAIVKSLLDRMGGEIQITSQQGVGSTFVITIPFEVAPAPEDAPKLEPEPQGNIRGLKLLLAEDNDLNAEIAQVLLSDKGAEVTAVADGQQALELFRSSAPGTFDAILMDIMMPVMDGLTAARAIRSLDRPDAAQIPILAMTANAFDEDAEKCLEAGMNAHLAKPLEIEKVAAKIAQCCGTMPESK